jgi:ABC-type nitrate/sulfonate/bicarbonate transport system permease component
MSPLTFYVLRFNQIIERAAPCFLRPAAQFARVSTAERAAAAVLVALTLLGWEAAIRLTNTPPYLLPAPLAIAGKVMAQPGLLSRAGLITLAEAVAGLALGSGLGLALAVLLNFKARLEPGVMALALLAKATPIIAIAPILTIWLGFGPAPKVIITALMTFFPVLINALSGFRAADPAILDVLHSLNASPREIFWHVRWPGARPYLFAALKVAGPLAMIGAVVAEWMGASSGLGREMWLAYSNLNMPALFAAVFVLTVLSTALYQSILRLEKRFLFWV